jgi:hypothetical protein
LNEFDQNENEWKKIKRIRRKGVWKIKIMKYNKKLNNKKGFEFFEN